MWQHFCSGENIMQLENFPSTMTTSGVFVHYFIHANSVDLIGLQDLGLQLSKPLFIRENKYLDAVTAINRLK